MKKRWLWVIAVVLVGGWLWKPKVRVSDQEIGVEVTEAPIEKFRFGVMADVHLDWENFKKALEIAKGRGEKMVIVAGDLTSLGPKTELAEAKKILDNSGVKYWVVPGNHDLWMGDKQKRNIFGEVFGKGYQSIEENGIKYILVNNGSWLGLGKEQRGWLEGEVEECRVVFCVVIMHMPLQNNFSEHVMGEDNPKVATEAAELVRLFKENGIREIIAGHLHYASAYEIDGLKTTLVGAIAADRNNQTPRFTEFEIEGDSLKREVVVLEEKK